MKTVSLTAARKQLSALLREVSRGETVVITRRHRPVATLSPIPQRRKALRPWGLYKGQVEISDDFNDPLPDFERAFYRE